MDMKQAKNEARNIAGTLLFDALGSEVITGNDEYSDEDKKRVIKAMCQLILQIDPDCAYNLDTYLPEGETVYK